MVLRPSDTEARGEEKNPRVKNPLKISSLLQEFTTYYKHSTSLQYERVARFARRAQKETNLAHRAAGVRMTLLLLTPCILASNAAALGSTVKVWERSSFEDVNRLLAELGLGQLTWLDKAVRAVPVSAIAGWREPVGGLAQFAISTYAWNQLAPTVGGLKGLKNLPNWAGGVVGGAAASVGGLIGNAAGSVNGLLCSTAGPVGGYIGGATVSARGLIGGATRSMFGFSVGAARGTLSVTSRLLGLAPSPVQLSEGLLARASRSLRSGFTGVFNSPLSVLLILLGGAGVDRLVQRLEPPRASSHASMPVLISGQQGACLLDGPLRFAPCRTAAPLAAANWQFERADATSGVFSVGLTTQLVLGTLRRAAAPPLFAVALADTPHTVRLCADHWCVRCLSRTDDGAGGVRIGLCAQAGAEPLAFSPGRAEGLEATALRAQALHSLDGGGGSSLGSMALLAVLAVLVLFLLVPCGRALRPAARRAWLRIVDAREQSAAQRVAAAAAATAAAAVEAAAAVAAKAKAAAAMTAAVAVAAAEKKKAKMGPEELAAEAERKAAVLAAKQARQWARAARQEPDVEEAAAIAAAIASRMRGGDVEKVSILDFAAAPTPSRAAAEAAPPAAAAPAAATRAPGRLRGAERAWGSTKEMLDGMPQTTEEEERKAWAVDDAMAYGRRAGINYPGGSPVSPPAMRAKAAANGLATPTSLATPASLRTGQRKPKVGSAEWMQTVDKTRRSTLLSDAESGRSSAKRLEF